MIRGKVDGRGAIIRLTVHGSDGAVQSLRVKIDTGFNGFLTLRPETILSLDLPYIDIDAVCLANDEFAEMRRFSAIVELDGRDVPVYIHESRTFPLAGLGLLADHELALQVCSGGKVTITPLKVP